MKFVLTLVCCGMLFLNGCSNGAGGTEDLTAQELTELGWVSYSAKDYVTALTHFSEALAKDAAYADAYNGRGWSHAQTNDLTTAATDFTDGIARSAALLDLRAGLAFVHNARKEYPASVQRGLEVVQTNPSWVFPRDHAISASDVRLLLAAGYFAQGNYTAALQQVVLLNASFTADVSTVNGQRALAEEIERLRSVV